MIFVYILAAVITYFFYRWAFRKLHDKGYIGDDEMPERWR